jgi:hypothetical protein
MTNQFFKTKIEEAEIKKLGIKVWNEYKGSYGNRIKNIDNEYVRRLVLGAIRQSAVNSLDKSEQAVKEALLKINNRIEKFETDNHLRIEGKSIKSLVNLKEDINKIAKEYLGIDLEEKK